MLKSAAELKKLPPDSQDIYKKGMIDRYAERPSELDNVCLADFIACYTFKGHGKQSTIVEEGIQEDHNVEEIDEANMETKKIKISDGTLTKRKTPMVIRYIRYDFHKDPANFFRERLMLFKSWRNELNEIENVNSEAFYQQHKDEIEKNSKTYISTDIDMSSILREIEEQRDDADECDSDEEMNREHNIFDYEDNTVQCYV